MTIPVNPGSTGQKKKETKAEGERHRQGTPKEGQGSTCRNTHLAEQLPSCSANLINYSFSSTISIIEAKLFSVEPNNRIRGTRHKQKQREFHRNTRKNFCTVWVTEHWHRLPRGCQVSLVISNSHLAMGMGTLLCVALLEKGWARWT